MINISELKGTRIKKAIGADSVTKRYHNKNKSGGNFGFTIIKDKTLYDLSGYYNTEGHVHRLRFGQYWKAGAELPIKPTTFEDLINSINKIMKAMSDYEMVNK